MPAAMMKLKLDMDTPADLQAVRSRSGFALPARSNAPSQLPFFFVAARFASRNRIFRLHEAE